MDLKKWLKWEFFPNEGGEGVLLNPNLLLELQKGKKHRGKIAQAKNLCEENLRESFRVPFCMSPLLFT